MPKGEPARNLPPGWNLSKPGGWKRYEEEVEKVNEIIEKLADDEFCSSEDIILKLDKIQDKMKYKSFGKTKPMTARKEKLKEKVSGSDGKQAKDILKKHSDLMVAEISKIKTMKQGRTTNVFKMREVVAGGKKTNQEAHAIKHKDTNELVVSNQKIKEVSLK